MASGILVVSLRQELDEYMARKTKSRDESASKRLDVTIAQIVRRDRAFANPDIAVRRTQRKSEGTWYEVIARGDGNQTALLAGFRSEKDATRCKRALLDALNKVLVPLVLTR